MAQKITNDEGVEIEVYTADEVKAQTEIAVKAKIDEFGKIQATTEAERDEALKTLGERSGEFKQFRKLTEDQAGKLTLAERTIYENGLLLQKANDDRVAADKRTRDTQIDSVLKSKAGNNEKLLAKMKDMWAIIGIEANTVEEMENKSKMILGAISTTEPDLVATIAGFSSNGSYLPPEENKGGNEDFSNTEKGKKAANELGLILETPKK